MAERRVATVRENFVAVAVVLLLVPGATGGGFVYKDGGCITLADDPDGVIIGAPHTGIRGVRAGIGSAKISCIEKTLPIKAADVRADAITLAAPEATLVPGARLRLADAPGKSCAVGPTGVDLAVVSVRGQSVKLDSNIVGDARLRADQLATGCVVQQKSTLVRYFNDYTCTTLDWRATIDTADGACDPRHGIGSRAWHRKPASSWGGQGSVDYEAEEQRYYHNQRAAKTQAKLTQTLWDPDWAREMPSTVPHGVNEK